LFVFLTDEPNAAGNHHIEVTLDKEHVAKSPYDVRVDPGAFAGSSLIEKVETSCFCLCVCFLLVFFFEYTFLVRTKDRNGKNLPKGGESKNFTVEFEGPAKVEHQFEDLGNGTYLVCVGFLMCFLINVFFFSS
jgi:hypothetical protein